jgi:hypothetical protein
LGSEATSLLAKLTPADQKKIENIPVNALVNGTFKQPKVTTDMQQASKNLATQVLKMQKDKYIDKGTTALNNLLGGNKANATKTDTTKTSTPKEEIKNTVKDKANEALKGLFGKKKKE